MINVSSSYERPHDEEIKVRPTTESYSSSSKHRGTEEREFDFSKYKRELLGDSYEDHYYSRSRQTRSPSLTRVKYEPDEYTSRLIDKALGGAYRSTEERLLTHPILDDNRPDPFTNPKISPRSRKVIREGYMLGFTNSQGIRALYDVNISVLCVVLCLLCSTFQSVSMIFFSVCLSAVQWI